MIVGGWGGFCVRYFLGIGKMLRQTKSAGAVLLADCGRSWRLKETVGELIWGLTPP
jgi:hypothetical protein